MNAPEGGEVTAPLLPCRSAAETLDFYRALGFAVVYDQRTPYIYLTVRRGGIELNFSDFRGSTHRPGFTATLVMVAQVAPYHRAFADALRAKYGRVPTAGSPRLSRMPEGLGRFGLFDPAGNWLIFVEPPEADGEDWHSGEGQEAMSPLATAVGMAALFRDYKGNDDPTAAKILDVALARHGGADPLDRALALACRAELAVAMGDAECARAARAELGLLPLSEEDRDRHRAELSAADALERWITGRGGEPDGPPKP